MASDTLVAEMARDGEGCLCGQAQMLDIDRPIVIQL